MLVHARRAAFETAIQVSRPARVLNVGLARPAAHSRPAERQREPDHEIEA
jgi:hypothetical protein